MGHANVSNISDFFVNQLYTKGAMSINEMVDALAKAKETVHASEGEYDDLYMLDMVVCQVIDYLTKKDPTRHGYSGPRGGGPWIEPALTAWHGKRKQVSPVLRAMLDEVDKGYHDATSLDQEELTAQAAADKLIEEGFEDWAAKVRLLHRQRRLLHEWHHNENDEWDYDEDDPDSDGTVFNNIKWRFCKGVRKNYRDVPRLNHITN